MRIPIYIVSGSKGGVGKSFVAIMLVDYLIQRGYKVFVIDADKANADVWKCYKDELSCERIDLSVVEGWIAVADLCGEHPDCIFVINTPAGNNIGAKLYGDRLLMATELLGRQLLALWVMSDGKDSVLLLKEFMEALPEARVSAVRNLYHGIPETFSIFDQSSHPARIAECGGKCVYFPAVAKRVADEIRDNRMTPAKGVSDGVLTIGTRVELLRWRRVCGLMFDEVAL